MFLYLSGLKSIVRKPIIQTPIHIYFKLTTEWVRWYVILEAHLRKRISFYKYSKSSHDLYEKNDPIWWWVFSLFLIYSTSFIQPSYQLKL